MTKRYKDVGPIKTWKAFDSQVRPFGCTLLSRLGRYPDAILVAGCQRSGTTILSNTIIKSHGVVDYTVENIDDELMGALILFGVVEHYQAGRYCFQTTYLDECYKEYFEEKYDFKLIWIIRNPCSVVYSMVYNWSRRALNDLFRRCGSELLCEMDLLRYKVFGRYGLSRIRKAAYVYNSKVSQALEIKHRLKDRVMFLDYDEMVADRFNILHQVYKFIELEFKPAYAEVIHNKSVSKANKLPPDKRRLIMEICEHSYERARRLVTKA